MSRKRAASSTCLTLAVLCALAIPVDALGQEIRLGGEFQVNTYTGAAQRYASVAANAAGNFVVVWASAGEDGAGGGVFARRFSSSGAPLAVEFQVNTYTGTNQAYPAVATSASGDFVVVWDSYGQDGSVYGIFARLFSSAGVAVGLDFQINSRTTSSQSRPAVTREATGAFVVTWSSGSQDGQGFGIFARRLSSTGGVFGVEFQVNTHTITDQFMPAIASDLDGDFVVAWQSSLQDGSGDGVFARRFSSVGVPLGTEFQVSLYTEDTQQLPAVAMDSDGDFVVAWQSQGQDGSNYGVFARRFSSAGAAVTGEIPVNVHTTAAQGYPAVSSAADGDFVVVWESNNQDGLFPSVFGRRFASTGRTSGHRVRGQHLHLRRADHRGDRDRRRRPQHRRLAESGAGRLGLRDLRAALRCSDRRRHRRQRSGRPTHRRPAVPEVPVRLPRRDAHDRSGRQWLHPLRRAGDRGLSGRARLSRAHRRTDRRLQSDPTRHWVERLVP